MQLFAHPVDGVVREIVSIPDGETVQACFQATFAAELVPCSDAVRQGWTYDGAAFAASVAPALSAEALIAYAVSRQWALATGGFTATVAGAALTFDTDTTSQALITGKAVRLGQASPPATIAWLFSSGFVTLTAANFMAAAVKIADFVQATFDTLKTVMAGIAGGTITSYAQIDAAFAAVPSHD